MASGAFDLLQKLHRVIEELQEEIKNLQLQNQMLKTQNEELKMERDEVGTQNPKQLTHAHQSKVKCQNGQPSAIERKPVKCTQQFTEEVAGNDENPDATEQEIYQHTDNGSLAGSSPLLGSTQQRRKKQSTIPRLTSDECNSIVEKSDCIIQNLSLQVREETKEADSELNNPLQEFRSRLATVGQPVKKSNSGSKSGKNDKKTSSLQRRNTFPSAGRQFGLYDVNYLSPDMEMRIQQMIQMTMAKKYGGLERITRAAIVIQSAYRKYKNLQHFQHLLQLQQDSIERCRTMSVEYPHKRKPSMISRKSRPVSSNVNIFPLSSLSPKISRQEFRTKKSFTLTESPLCSQANVSPFQPEIQPIKHQSIKMPFSASRPMTAQQKQGASALQRKINIGTNIFNRHPQRGIQYLIVEGVLEDSPYAVADFLKTYHFISKEKIGEFVGEIRSEFNMAVLQCLVEMIELANKTIDEAIRDFQKLFRMPGEAQKIDAIMQVFASEYYQRNQSNIIKSEDAAYILSFAIMMLHTDLHNPSVKKHMTKAEWIKMNRGTNDEEDFPESFLLEIYNQIQQKAFETGIDHTHQVLEIRKQIIGHVTPPLVNPQRRFTYQCGIAEVKDVHKKKLGKHHRILFVFNDLLLVTKPVGVGKYEFRKSFTLLHSQAMKFNTQYYKYGVCLQHELSGETYHCNCDTEEDRNVLLERLSETILELTEMENERISDITYKGKHHTMLKGYHTMKTESVTRDLIQSVNMEQNNTGK